MKVRIEFSEPEEDQGMESPYKIVEFTAEHADCIEGWSDAIDSIVRLSAFDGKAICLNALFYEDVAGIGSGEWIDRHRDNLRDLRDSLTRLLDEAGTE
ncbi:hypothetical protein [Kordiimonas sp.]|uniref:hypothetical protein n=1 Tax=Kordiimonas sp. TaxID=1970157 RepID=UPI003A9174C3